MPLLRPWLAALLIALAAAPPSAGAESTPLQVEVMASGLQQPWSLAFIDAERALITEKPGRLRLFANGQLQADAIAGVPEVYHAGQGGLLEVLVDRDFARNRRIYLSYAHGAAGANATRVISARLVERHLADIRVLFTAQPYKSTPVHYGGRMLQLPDGSLLIGLGDGFDYRESAQDLGSHLGKLVRIGRDGEIPLDNPFVGRSDALPEIWSFGHRNVQGLAMDPRSGAILAHEHGPRGGDELNRIVSSGNYGWPLATHGIDYSGALVSPFHDFPGALPPLRVWTPSIAPAGLAIVQGPLFPDWQGDLLVTALAGQALHHLRPDGDGGYREQPKLLVERAQRLRDVRIGPDGAIWVLTDGNEGELWRLSPAH